MQGLRDNLLDERRMSNQKQISTLEVQRAIQERPQLYSSSTYKAMTLIEELARTPEKGFVSKADLSKRTGLDKSAVYRILNTISLMGYLERENKRYRLGLKFLELTQSLVRHYNLREIAHPFMVALAQEVGERVFLALLDHDSIVQIDIVEGNPWIRITSDVGTRFPLYASSAGKLFLADMPDETLKWLLDTLEMTPVTEKTITDRARLMAEIEAVRAQGFAVSNEESRVHERAVSVPIKDEQGRTIACLGVAGTVLTFTTEKMMNVVGPLLTSASRIANAPNV